MFGKKRTWDLLLIAGLLLLSGILYLTLNLNQEYGSGVIVEVDGQELVRYGLHENGIYALNGGTNTLVIENGEAWLSHADCPDLLCVKQGKIRSGGQCITCLPNRLTVTVFGAADNGGVELIS